MTRDEMDALIARHDRWSAYDALTAILALTASLALMIVGTFILWGTVGTGAGLTLIAVGGIVGIVALNVEPYQAR